MPVWVCYHSAMILHRGTFAVVDDVAIESNIRNLRTLLRPDTRMLVAVKANGYGHGAIAVAQAVLRAGATDIGVASLEEALELRCAGIRAPILVLGVVPVAAARTAAEHDIDITVSSDWQPVLQAITDGGVAVATALGLAGLAQPLRIHLKYDTGMARLGYREEAPLLAWARALQGESSVTVSGLFTHLASADVMESSTAAEQLQKLADLVQRLGAEGLRPAVVHAANSAAMMRSDAYHLDMVRVGISAYGYRPNPVVESPVPLIPAISLYAFLTRVETVAAGTAIGYGGTHVTTRRSVIGTVPVGYADGYPRWLSNRGSVVIHGQRAPILGRICMDQLMVDLTDIPAAATGDCVCLYGRHAPASWTAEAVWRKTRAGAPDFAEDWLLRTYQRETSPAAVLSLDELAELGDTISYELMCALSTRVPRLYLSRYNLFDMPIQPSV